MCLAPFLRAIRTFSVSAVGCSSSSRSLGYLPILRRQWLSVSPSPMVASTAQSSFSELYARALCVAAAVASVDNRTRQGESARKTSRPDNFRTLFQKYVACVCCPFPPSSRQFSRRLGCSVYIWYHTISLYYCCCRQVLHLRRHEYDPTSESILRPEYSTYGRRC